MNTTDAYRLVDSDTGKHECWARDIITASALSHVHKNARVEPNPDFGKQATAEPVGADHACLSAKGTPEVMISVRPGSIVIVRNADTGDVAGRIDVPHVPAKGAEP